MGFLGFCFEVGGGGGGGGVGGKTNPCLKLVRTMLEI